MMKWFSGLMIGLGLGLLVVSLVLVGLIFWPVAKVEWQYQKNKEILPVEIEQPVDREFGLVIPKIGANAKVIPNVDPNDSKSYQWALTKGVAHALGSALPGERGRVFIFSHSSANFYEASRYNSIFYLLNKLENGDSVKVYYEDEEYDYQVMNKKVVAASEVNYLTGGADGELVLMTCWPPGTNLKRLLIFATLWR